MKQKLTFKLKQYLHFTDRIEPADIQWVNRYIKNPECVRKHKFFPFIHRPIVQRKFRRGKEGTTTKERSLRVKKSKHRSILYANHLDRCIYSHYASKLVKAYELKLRSEPLVNDAVVAYRDKDFALRSLSTVETAKAAFEFIRNFPDNEFMVVAMDISGFFDNLGHRYVKACWKDFMGFDGELPPDHYAVFKNITNYSFVNYHDVFEAFRDHHGKKYPSHLPSSKVKAFAPSVGEFRKRIIKRHLVRRPDDSGRKIGIPQGSPISPVLANMYMFEFDKFACELLQSVGGLYRRYSDDILLVYPVNADQRVYQPLMDKICEQPTALEIQPAKNQRYLATRNAGELISFQDVTVTPPRPATGLVYLGFLFDGNVIRIRSGSISSYYRKMKRTVRRAAFYASTTGKRRGQPYIYKNLIYKKHTHVGAERKLIHKRSVEADGTFKMVRTNRMDWGNFLSYAYQVSRVLEGKDRKAVLAQMKRHMRLVQHEIKRQSLRRGLEEMP